MFIVLLKFSMNRNKASQFIMGHNEWIKNGFNDGVFLLVGSLKPSLGGAVLAHKISKDDLLKRIDADPFVTENVVSAEILEIDPNQVIPEMDFLKKK